MQVEINSRKLKNKDIVAHAEFTSHFSLFSSWRMVHVPTMSGLKPPNIITKCNSDYY